MEGRGREGGEGWREGREGGREEWEGGREGGRGGMRYSENVCVCEVNRRR